MCGCKRRRAARAAWLEQRAAGGRGCGRGFGPGAGPPFRPPFMGGPFGRWRDTPRNGPEEPSQSQPLNPPGAQAPRDIEKAPPPSPPTQREAARVSFMSGPFSRFRESIRSDTKTDIKRESTTTLPPRYASGVTEASRTNMEKQAGKRESLPPAYDVATKY